MSFVFEFVQLFEPLFEWLRVLNQLLLGYLFPEFYSFLLLFLLFFLLLAERWFLNDVLGISPPLSRGDWQLRYHRSAQHLILRSLEAEFDDLVAQASEDSPTVGIDQLLWHKSETLVAL